ncbi:MAG: 7-dehydrocholesterol reductase [Polyangiaceae bacterium]|nr:7-dehydrocholesterol reductase [Polyangiaceae bacterium]
MSTAPATEHLRDVGRFFERTIGPLLLMLVCPPLTLILWVIVTRYDGSIAAYVGAFREHRVYRLLPLPSWWGVGVIGGWIGMQWALLRFLPGPIHRGPVTPRGVQPEYRQNGLLAWSVTHALLVVGFGTGWLPARAFFERYGELLATLTVGAFLFCCFLYAKALIAPNSPDRVRTHNPVYDFFMGVELHPTVGSTSIKQLLNCRVSMMGWSAVDVAACAYQIETQGTLSTPLLASSLILVFYLFKFFAWETGYFASLDIMHDRFGFYVCWGVLAWVPAVYPIAQIYLAVHTTELSVPVAGAIALAGIGAISMNYAADAQRQRVRQSGGSCRVWWAPPKVIRAQYRCEDGSTRENLLLTSGYWGLSRHFHYVPELMTAVAWTIPAGTSHALPYIYVVFLGILLFHRAERDDARCAGKYGPAWVEYKRRVPYRILPGLY